MRKPKLIISKCLNSEKCRYNGQAYDDKVISLLRKYVDLETVCPETEIGLKVPRNPIRIEKYDNKYKLVEPSDNIDYTSQMMEFAEEFLSNIDDVDGFILKSKSPSCGIRDVKVYPKNQKCSINKKGQGIFSSKIIEKYSTIPIEDEGRLKNYNIRDEFLTKIFTINNLKCENSILDFHNKNSLLLKSYNEDIYNDLNIIVSKENMNEDDKTLYKNKVYEILNNKRDYQIVYSFLNDIISKSKDLGVEINTDKSYINLTPINIKNENVFELNIIQIIENYNNPVLVILEKENIDKYYETLKKIFGGRNSIATQFVDLDTIKRCDPKIDNKRGKESIFLNILLGIYCKSGIQPWVLANGLSADCYIGLDVCRENNMSTAGLIQVIGKDGRVLKSKTISSHQSGEKIQINILKDIIFEAKQAYKNTYNKKLEHIVFHRDGINREDIDLLKEITNSLEIKFDYVEVTKNINRRMAMLEKSDENYNHRDKENKKWITEIGMCLKKENEAYLITTNPSENMGMARPLRIKKVYGNQKMDDIVKDIYKLSFMHIGSIMKSRLPITTHYADLSSIYSHRELMPKSVDNNILHFI